MAGVESAAAPPQVPPPPPGTAAPALALRLADFVVVVACGLFGFAWLSSAATAAFIAAEWGYGWASIQAAVTKEIAVATSVLLGLFIHAIAMILASACWRDAHRRTEGREEQQVHGAVIGFLVVLFVIFHTGVLIQVLSWAKGDRDEKAGYLLLESLFFLGCVVFCFVTSPMLIIRIVMAARPETQRSEMAVSH